MPKRGKSKIGKAVKTSQLSQLSPPSNASSSKISDISNNSYASLATPDPSSDEVEVPSLLDVIKEIRTVHLKVELVHQQSNKQQQDLTGLTAQMSEYAKLSDSPGA